MMADKYDIMRETDEYLSRMDTLMQRLEAGEKINLSIVQVVHNGELVFVLSEVGTTYTRTDFDPYADNEAIRPSLILNSSQFLSLFSLLAKGIALIPEQNIRNFNYQDTYSHFQMELSEPILERPTYVKREPESQRKKPGFIYILHSQHGYKIGKSMRADERVTHFTLQLPFAVEVIRTLEVPDMAPAEKYLHNLFSGQRINGEWFALSEEDLSKIDELHQSGFFEGVE